MADDQDPELTGIRDSEYLTMADRLRAKFSPITKHADSGEVLYPRRQYLQDRATQRKTDAELAARAKSGK